MGASNNAKSTNLNGGPPSLAMTMKVKLSDEEPLLPNAITLSNLLSRPGMNSPFGQRGEHSPLSEGNQEALKLRELLSENGWAFVLLPEDIRQLSADCVPALREFFHREDEYKLKYHENLKGESDKDGVVYGYNQTANRNKEGLRLLSGGRMLKKWIPDECAASLPLLVDALDKVMIQILRTSSQTLFNMSFEELSQKYEIPLIAGLPNGTDIGTLLTEQNFAMVDVAHYPNAAPTVVSEGVECNVAGHIDPGLLSFSILSTQEGLQVKNKEGEWVDCPTDSRYGILWAGELAQIISPDIKPGWHRVKYLPEQAWRLTIWIEVCSKQQDLAHSFSYFDKVTFPKDMVFQLPGLNMELLEKIDLNRNGQNKPHSLRTLKRETTPTFDMLYVKEGETLSSALRRASRIYGMPLSKTIRYYCPLCLSTVMSLESHFNEVHPTRTATLPRTSKDAELYDNYIETFERKEKERYESRFTKKKDS